MSKSYKDDEISKFFVANFIENENLWIGDALDSQAEMKYKEWQKRKSVDFALGFCRTGQGINILANKTKNVRAALCHNVRSAKLSRQHNNANIIAFGSRLINKKNAFKCIGVFLKTSFEGGRHLRRIKKI